MRDQQTRYWDIELLDLGDGQYATVTHDDAVLEFDNHEAAEQSVRQYRQTYGRRQSDGGPLEWPPVERTFKGEPWSTIDPQPKSKPKAKAGR